MTLKGSIQNAIYVISGDSKNPSPFISTTPLQNLGLPKLNAYLEAVFNSITPTLAQFSTTTPMSFVSAGNLRTHTVVALARTLRRAGT